MLVVEDNPELNRFIAETLADAHAVDVAMDGREGLEKVLESPPDLVVTDIMMPRMSGDELIAELRRRPHLATVPVLVLSAKADDELRVRLLGEGAQDYLVKPFSRAELLARAGNLIKLKRATDVLQAEVSQQQQDIEALAREVATRKRGLAASLAEAELARDEARRASEAKASFLRLVSHELRAPLQGITLQAELLKRKLGDRPELRGADRILIAGRHMTRLVDGLLEYVRAEAGRLEAQPELVDACDLVRDIAEELGPMAANQGLKLHVEAGSAPCWSDPRLLRLVVANLVDNAIKYTLDGSVQVQVQVTADDSELRFTVTDTGPGIPREHWERILQPFEQVGDLRHKHISGTGLGLALVKRALDVLGGRLEIDSTVGQGSRFTAVVPLEHERKEAERGAHPGG